MIAAVVALSAAGLIGLGAGVAHAEGDSSGGGGGSSSADSGSDSREGSDLGSDSGSGSDSDSGDNGSPSGDSADSGGSDSGGSDSGGSDSGGTGSDSTGGDSTDGDSTDGGSAESAPDSTDTATEGTDDGSTGPTPDTSTPDAGTTPEPDPARPVTGTDEQSPVDVRPGNPAAEPDPTNDRPAPADESGSGEPHTDSTDTDDAHPVTAPSPAAATTESDSPADDLTISDGAADTANTEAPPTALDEVASLTAASDAVDAPAIATTGTEAGGSAATLLLAQNSLLGLGLTRTASASTPTLFGKAIPVLPSFPWRLDDAEWEQEWEAFNSSIVVWVPGVGNTMATISTVIDVYQFATAINARDRAEIADEIGDVTGDLVATQYTPAVGNQVRDLVHTYVADTVAGWIIGIIGTTARAA